VSARSVARRYATALLDVTRQSGSQDRAGKDLAELTRTIAGHPELSRVLESPGIPPGVKRTIVAALLDKAGGLSPEVRRLVTMLADRDRVALLGDVAAAFEERLREEKKEVRAEIVTAVPLKAGSRAALGDALSRATGRRVTIAERVDPAIVGGVIARVGGTVYDGSVTRQLERMRDRLNGDI
jgi:F-type H+-transporting ATPase subunit delta